jgi:hypothetical protein
MLGAAHGAGRSISRQQTWVAMHQFGEPYQHTKHFFTAESSHDVDGTRAGSFSHQRLMYACGTSDSQGAATAYLVGLRPGLRPAPRHTVHLGPGLTCPSHACVMAGRPYQLCRTAEQSVHRQWTHAVRDNAALHSCPLAAEQCAPGPVQPAVCFRAAWKQLARNACPVVCDTAFWARCMFSNVLMFGEVLLCSYKPLVWTL